MEDGQVSDNGKEQWIAPKVRVVGTTIQVGAPVYLEGALVTFDLEVTYTHWKKRRFGRGWAQKPEIIPKTVSCPISADEIERLFDEWKDGIIQYEAWLLAIKEKAKAYGEELDRQAQANKEEKAALDAAAPSGSV